MRNASAYSLSTFLQVTLGLRSANSRRIRQIGFLGHVLISFIQLHFVLVHGLNSEPPKLDIELLEMSRAYNALLALGIPSGRKC